MAATNDALQKSFNGQKTLQSGSLAHKEVQPTVHHCRNVVGGHIKADGLDVVDADAFETVGDDTTPRRQHSRTLHVGVGGKEVRQGFVVVGVVQRREVQAVNLVAQAVFVEELHKANLTLNGVVGALVAHPHRLKQSILAVGRGGLAEEFGNQVATRLLLGRVEGHRVGTLHHSQQLF